MDSFTEGDYAAIIGFELDCAFQELRYVGAGITRFYVNGEKIEIPGMFVGLWDNAEFTVGKLAVSGGDSFFFLTDGFTDALAQTASTDFGARGGKDFNTDITALGLLAASGKLRDDATGVCLKIKALCHSSDRKGQYNA